MATGSRGLAAAAAVVALAGCAADSSPAQPSPSPVVLGAEQTAALEAMRTVHDAQVADGSYDAFRRVAVGASGALVAAGYPQVPAIDSMLSATVQAPPGTPGWSVRQLNDAGLETEVAVVGAVTVAPALEQGLWKATLSGGADPSVCVTFEDSRTFAYTVAASPCPLEAQVRAQQTLFQLSSAAAQVAGGGQTSGG